MDSQKKKKEKKSTEKSNTPAEVSPEKSDEFGGRGGLDPVRFGDWEIKGKCVDF